MNKDQILRLSIHCSILFLLFLTGTSLLHAQTGAITGKVHTEGTDSALVGTNVLLPQLDRGVSTDESGQFVFRNVPAGTYDLQVSFYRISAGESRIRAG